MFDQPSGVAGSIHRSPGTGASEALARAARPAVEIGRACGMKNRPSSGAPSTSAAAGAFSARATGPRTSSPELGRADAEPGTATSRRRASTIDSTSGRARRCPQSRESIGGAA
jgi:hypothetical protein